MISNKLHSCIRDRPKRTRSIKDKTTKLNVTELVRQVKEELKTIKLAGLV